MSNTTLTPQLPMNLSASHIRSHKRSSPWADLAYAVIYQAARDVGLLLPEYDDRDDEQRRPPTSSNPVAVVSSLGFFRERDYHGYAAIAGIGDSTMARVRTEALKMPMPVTHKRAKSKRRPPGTPRRTRATVAQHGTNSKYNAGCDCDDCKRAHREYARKWLARRRAAGLPTRGAA